MNAKQRKRIGELAEQIESIKEEIDEIQCLEADKLENMSESLQESERGEAMQEVIDTLESAVCSLEEAIDSLTEIVEG